MKLITVTVTTLILMFTFLAASGVGAEPERAGWEGAYAWPESGQFMNKTLQMRNLSDGSVLFELDLTEGSESTGTVELTLSGIMIIGDDDIGRYESPDGKISIEVSPSEDGQTFNITHSGNIPASPDGTYTFMDDGLAFSTASVTAILEHLPTAATSLNHNNGEYVIKYSDETDADGFYSAEAVFADSGAVIAKFLIAGNMRAVYRVDDDLDPVQIFGAEPEPPYWNGFDFGANLSYGEEYVMEGDPGHYLNAAEAAKLTFDAMKANDNIPEYSDDTQYTMTLVDLTDIEGEECYVYRLDVEGSDVIGAAYAYAYQSGNIYMQGQGGQWVRPEGNSRAGYLTLFADVSAGQPEEAPRTKRVPFPPAGEMPASNPAAAFFLTDSLSEWRGLDFTLNDVTFGNGEKRFQFPGAILQGFLKPIRTGQTLNRKGTGAGASLIEKFLRPFAAGNGLKGHIVNLCAQPRDQCFAVLITVGLQLLHHSINPVHIERRTGIA